MDAGMTAAAWLKRQTFRNLGKENSSSGMANYGLNGRPMTPPSPAPFLNRAKSLNYRPFISNFEFLSDLRER